MLLFNAILFIVVQNHIHIGGSFSCIYQIISYSNSMANNIERTLANACNQFQQLGTFFFFLAISVFGYFITTIYASTHLIDHIFCSTMRIFSFDALEVGLHTCEVAENINKCIDHNNYDRKEFAGKYSHPINRSSDCMKFAGKTFCGTSSIFRTLFFKHRIFC